MNLFRKRKTVLYITSGNLEGGNVVFTKDPIIKDSVTMSWTEDGISNSIKTMIAKLKSKKVLLALGEGFVHIVNITLPNNLSANEEAKYRMQEVKKIVNGDLDEKQWKFKEVAYHTDKKEILAYAPLTEKFKVLEAAFQDAKCSIIYIEPDIIAKARHQNVLIGTALGSIEAKRPQNTPLLHISKNISLEVSKSSRFTSKGIVAMVATTAVVCVALILTNKLNTKISNNIQPNIPQEEVIVIPEEPESPETTESVETMQQVIEVPEFKAEEYIIQILNGTTIDGLAARTSEKFKEAGFENIEIGNAETDEQLTTEIFFSNELSSPELKILVLELLESSGEGIISQDATADFYDVVIILGQDIAKKQEDAQ